jgi:hypothetical protein
VGIGSITVNGLILLSRKRRERANVRGRKLHATCNEHGGKQPQRAQS